MPVAGATITCGGSLAPNGRRPGLDTRMSGGLTRAAIFETGDLSLVVPHGCRSSQRTCLQRGSKASARHRIALGRSPVNDAERTEPLGRCCTSLLYS